MRPPKPAPGHREFLSARAQWKRGPARLNGDWVTLDSERLESYDLVGAFHARFKPDDPINFLMRVERREDVVAFVERFGLLRTRPPEALTEPVDLYFKAAKTLELVHALGRVWRKQKLTPTVEQFLARFPDWPRLTTQDARLRAVGGVLAQQLTAVLADVPTEVHLFVDPRGPRGDELLFGPPVSSALIQYIWYFVRSAIVGLVPLEYCARPACGRIFTVEHGRQRYCSTQCSALVRTERWQIKERERQERQRHGK